MRYTMLFACFVFVSNFVFAQNTPIQIVYETQDAFNTPKRNPEMAQYINQIGEFRPIVGDVRSSLRLYDFASIYTVDSVYISRLGYRSSAWKFPVVNIWKADSGQRFSVHSNLPCESGYLEKECPTNLKWIVDKNKTKTILGVKCYYASAKILKNFHQIWFTNELPYTGGPFLSEHKEGCNLPGLVLEHIMGDGFTTTAIDLTFKEPNPDLAEKIQLLEPWTTTEKPTFMSGQSVPEGMLYIKDEFETDKWVRLKYISNGQLDWIRD